MLPEGDQPDVGLQHISSCYFLKHTPRLSWLALTFTSPPIFHTDDPGSPLPAGYPGDRAISLKALEKLDLDFINHSFTHPSSQKFIDAIQCGDLHTDKGLRSLSFTSDHLNTWPFHNTNRKAYIPLGNIFLAYGRSLISFHRNIGADLLHSLPLRDLSDALAEPSIHSLDLSFPRNHPGQFSDKTADKPLRPDLSSLLHALHTQLDLNIHILTIEMPVTIDSLPHHLRELQKYVWLTMSRANWRNDWDGSRTIQVDLEVVEKNEGSLSSAVQPLTRDHMNVRTYATFNPELPTAATSGTKVDLASYVCIDKQSNLRRKRCNCHSDSGFSIIGSVHMVFYGLEEAGGKWAIQCFERQIDKCDDGELCNNERMHEVNVASRYDAYVSPSD